MPTTRRRRRKLQSAKDCQCDGRRTGWRVKRAKRASRRFAKEDIRSEIKQQYEDFLQDQRELQEQLDDWASSMPDECWLCSSLPCKCGDAFQGELVDELVDYCSRCGCWRGACYCMYDY